jgi:hypothetical protein
VEHAFDLWAVWRETFYNTFKHGGMALASMNASKLQPIPVSQTGTDCS